MDVYIVFQQGVYRHECGGVFLTLEEASAVALQMIRAERDDYHTYAVMKLMVGVVSPFTGYGPDEPPCVEEYSRKDPPSAGYRTTRPIGITITKFDEQGTEVSKTTITTGE